MLFLLRRYRIAPKRDIFSKGLYSLVRWPSFLLASVSACAAVQMLEHLRSGLISFYAAA